MNVGPTGTVTFVFTDIVGSTRLWADDSASMNEALVAHDSLLRGAVERADGYLVKTMGDGLMAAFADPVDAVLATIAMQRALEVVPSTGPPLRVRIAVHSGHAEERDGDYFGPTLNRTARLMSIGHGGQVLLSGVTAGLVRDRLPDDARLVDLGEHRLRDLLDPEHVFQLTMSDLPAEFPPLRSLDLRATNVPHQVTSFVGRSSDVTHIEELLAVHRLVTLVGVGGVGKTRLATHVAAEVVDQFADGAWFVDLSATDGARVVESIARVLRLDLPPTGSVEPTLVEALRSRSVLLVLDNCEHVVREARRIVELALGEGQGVRILATSREALRAPGEHVVAVPSLDEAGACELFLDRARAADSSFTVVDDEAVNALCQRLDGIPLAIELAAARVRMFSVDELVQRVEQRFRLLTGGRGDLERHQTLRAAIDWSYDLLDERERAVFNRLSVMAGGGTLDAVEAVVSGDGVDGADVLELLAGLVDKSLVGVDRAHADTRYEMLETIRQYAQERLVASGEAESTRDRHAAWYAEFARQAGRGLYKVDAAVWVDHLVPELDNLQVAVAWAAATGATDDAMRIGASFPRQASRPELGTVHLAEAALAADGADTHPLRARVLAEAGWAAVLRGDFDTGRERLERSAAALAEGARYTAAAHTYLLTLASIEGRFDEAYEIARDGVANAEAAGDLVGETALRSAMVMYSVFLDKVSESLPDAERALRDARALGASILETVALHALAVVLSVEEPDRAIALLQEADELARRDGLSSEEAPRLSLLAYLTGKHRGPVEGLDAAHALVTALSRFRQPEVSPYELGSYALVRAGRPDLAARFQGVGSSHVWERVGTAHLYARFSNEERAVTRQALGDERYEHEYELGRAAELETFTPWLLSEIDTTRRR